MAKSNRGRVVFAIAGAAWLAIATAGLAVVVKHEAGAGQAGQAQSRWPDRSQLARDPARPTLVVIVHPECACTNASITELERLMARQSSRLAVRALMVVPRGLAGDPRASTKWARLERIPGVTVTLDAGGREATLFGAHTSGQTILYDAHGALVFQGGMTMSRGHEGDNEGVAAIEAFVTGDDVGVTAPVYGCALEHGGAP